MQRNTLLAASAIVSALLALSACGGTAALSKPAYINKADAICKTASTQIKGLGSPKDAKGFVTLLDRATPIETKLLSDLEGLAKPKADAKALQTQYFDVYDRAVTQLKKVQVEADKAGGDPAKLSKLAGSLNGFNTAAADKYIGGYGIHSCSQGGG